MVFGVSGLRDRVEGLGLRDQSVEVSLLHKAIRLQYGVAALARLFVLSLLDTSLSLSLVREREEACAGVYEGGKRRSLGECRGIDARQSVRPHPDSSIHILLRHFDKT